jgi:hypothetical protein
MRLDVEDLMRGKLTTSNDEGFARQERDWAT